MVIRRTLLSGCSTVGLRVAQFRPAWWSGGEGWRWVADPVEQCRPGVLPGPGPWEVQRDSAGRGGDPCGHRDQLAAERGCGRPRQVWVAEAGGRAGEVERDDGEHEPGGVGVEHS
jgi:hypothetical protein